MKVIFSMFSFILLLTGLCFEGSANLTLEEMVDKLDDATLISGLNIPKNSILELNKKNAFVPGNHVRSKFLLLKQLGPTCGTTSAEMVLHYYGQEVGQREIWEHGSIYVIEVGSFPSEIEEALDGLGVQAEWYSNTVIIQNLSSILADPLALPAAASASLDQLRAWVKEDRPPIILLRFGLVLHYVVVVGYNNQGDFLLADPNGLFRWMSAAELAFGWSLQPPGLPNEGFAVEDGIEKFGLSILTPAVELLTGGWNAIVPDAPPNKHFPPNKPVLFHTYGIPELAAGRKVQGGFRFNPTWSTDPWEETFTFTEDIADYRVSGVVPAEVWNLGGFELAFIQGSKKVDNRTVKVWGRISPGQVTRGKIFVFVRGYKESLYGIKTESTTRSHKFNSSWGFGWDDSWQSFTFPGHVLNYTISAKISWFDRERAKLLEHYQTGNQVKFKIALKRHKLEPNEITVYVTAHYEPVTPGRFEVYTRGGGLKNIPSGDHRTIIVKVYSTRGHLMPGVGVRFIDSDDAEIAFSPTSASTNNSGEAKSTMKTGSSGNADFTIGVDELASRKYQVSVVKKLKTHTTKKWFSSRRDWWRDWYTAEGHIDVPSWVSIHSYSISTHVPLEDRLTAPYVRKHWRRGNRVHLSIRFKEHWTESNDILVRVHAKYWGTAPSPGAPSAVALPNPEVRPDPESLTAAWQDLSHVPSHTALLPNYPNPFNPETWIPYNLATDAEVTLTIYDATGVVVRQLDLGHQPAGTYQNRRRAAYWDGRNTVGEPVASGIYFYQLMTEDFSETRKMLILK